MPRDFKVYLEDIVTSIDKINSYIASTGIEDNGMLSDAVLYNLQIIGEAVKQLPDEIRDKYPQIKWRKIAGLRDVIAHQYFAISDEIIRDIINNHLPPLRKQVRHILVSESSKDSN